MSKQELTINQQVDRIAELGNDIMDLVNKKVATGEYSATETAVALSTINATMVDRIIDPTDIKDFIKLRLHKLYGGEK